jgi:hypothetical protein
MLYNNVLPVVYPGIFSGGGSTNLFEDRGQRNADLGAVGVQLNLQNRTLIRLLRMYFPRNREFGLALSKLWNFGAGVLTTQTPPWYANVCYIFRFIKATIIKV